MSALSKKQAYQLRIQRSYAELRGLPLDLPAPQLEGLRLPPIFEGHNKGFAYRFRVLLG